MTRLERGLLVATSVLATITAVGWFASAPDVRPSSASSVGGVIDVGVAPGDVIDSSSRAVAATDPFRLERRPTSVAYRPDLEGVAPPPKPPKSVLVLEGLVGNAALIDGAPGHPTTAIVHAGDTLGGLRIRRIGRDTVIVTDQDTTWRLTLRHAWQ